MDYFDYEFRVLYGHTDKMGISYYAHYFVWFEAARTEYFRALGFPYTECEKKGYFLPVAEAGIKYHAPSTYDDILVVRTSVGMMRKSSLRFEYETRDKTSQKLTATGWTVHVFVDKDMRPKRIPREIEEIVTVFRLLKD